MKRNNKKRKIRTIKPISAVRMSKGVFYPLQPPQMPIRLRVITNATLSGAVPAFVKRWNTNSAFQPETGGGTAATPGFSHWALLYGYYRVVSYEYNFTALNNEAFSVTIYSTNSNADPGTTTNSNLGANRLSWDRAVNAKGGIDTYKFVSPSITISEVVGTTSTYIDDTFRGLVTGNPADITWLGVGAQSISGSNLTNGIALRLELNMNTIFYDPITQT